MEVRGYVSKHPARWFQSDRWRSGVKRSISFRVKSSDSLEFVASWLPESERRLPLHSAPTGVKDGGPTHIGLESVCVYYLLWNEDADTTRSRVTGWNSMRSEKYFISPVSTPNTGRLHQHTGFGLTEEQHKNNYYNNAPAGIGIVGEKINWRCKMITEELIHYWYQI